MLVAVQSKRDGVGSGLAEGSVVEARLGRGGFNRDSSR